MQRQTNRVIAAAAALMALSAPAFAHTGQEHAFGFTHGFMHPVGGMDHVLAMVAVGLFAAQLGGRALWLVPMSFVTMMGLGGYLGLNGIEVPFVETGIGLSVVVLGAIVAMNYRPHVAFAMGLVGLFAIFHGHAHGAEMPTSASGLTYALGFMLATAQLHAGGIALGIGFQRLTDLRARRIARIGGAAMAGTGLGLIAGWF